MADAITPQGHLVVGYPYYDGMTTVFGLGRNWRFDQEWETRAMEVIDPLNALHPVGDKRPVDMAEATFDRYFNDAFRLVKVRGNPVKHWWYFYDGDVYETGAPLSTYAGKLVTRAARFPNWALHTIRHSPPENQGVYGWTSVTSEALWQDKFGNWNDAFLSVNFPKQTDDYSRPFLHIVKQEDVSGIYDVLTTGEILGEGPSGSSVEQEVDTLSWFFEPVMDIARFSGTHFILRNSADMDRWWHYYHPDIRLLSSKWSLVCHGAKQYVNLSPIRYGASGGHAWPHEGHYLPSAPGSSWEPSGQWFYTVTSAGGWSTDTVDFNATNAATYWQDHYDANKIRPYVTATRGNASAQYNRPVFWYVSEQHDATIAEADTTTETTDGNGDLLRMDYTQRQDWRGSSGSAEFRPKAETAYSSWRENAKVSVYMGMQTGATTIEEALIATGYILPGGITRSRAALDGNQATLSVKFGDFVAARMPGKEELPDVRQAGDQTLNDSTSSSGRWARMVCNRLGLPYTLLDVDSSVEDKLIPTADPFPSDPAFDKPDGQSMSGHMSAVCDAIKVRWGFDKDGDGKLFFDGGPPTWSTGDTPDFVIDEEASTDIDVVYSLTHESSVAEYRNCLKAVTGAGDDKWTAYLIDAVADRKASIGDDWWVSLQDDDSKAVPALVRLFYDEHSRYEKVIVWESIIRPDLRPDKFVRVDAASYTGIAAGTVFQIVEHRLEIDKGANTNKSTLTGVVVYEP